MAAARRPDRDATRPVYVISVAATLVSAHPRTLRIYEDEGLVCPARTPTNIRLYSEEDIRRILWIRHLTRDRGVNLAGVRALFELEERLGKRILEALRAAGIVEPGYVGASEARGYTAIRLPWVKREERAVPGPELTPDGHLPDAHREDSENVPDLDFL